MAAPLEVHEIVKKYRDVCAAGGVSFTLERGSMIGLLGPNGAGKTTVVSIIAGLVRQDSGQVRIHGEPMTSDDDPKKRHIGLVPQDLALYEEMTAEQNLSLFGSLYGISGGALSGAMDRALDLVGLGNRRKDKVAVYSGGMKRRLNLAAALLHDPDILLLDEPTVGVDPQSRNAIFENLEQLKRSGKALLYTTHYMEEAERLCDRIVIIDHGRVIANDTQKGIYQLLPAPNVLHVELARGSTAGTWFAELRSLRVVRSVDLDREHLRIGVTSVAEACAEVFTFLGRYGITYHHVGSERASLETVFLTLTGRTLRN